MRAKFVGHESGTFVQVCICARLMGEKGKDKKNKIEKENGKKRKKEKKRKDRKGVQRRKKGVGRWWN